MYVYFTQTNIHTCMFWSHASGMHAPASIYTNSRAVGEFLIEFDEAVALYDKEPFQTVICLNIHILIYYCSSSKI